MKIPPNITALIDKYQAGTASPDEIALLNEWYHSFDDSEIDFTTTPGETEHQIADRIRKRVLETIGREQSGAVVKIRRKWRLTAAAAIVVMGLAGLIYFLFSRDSTKPGPSQAITIQPSPVQKLVPGGNKALLTLADNTTIVLDSATNGIISIQGNSKVEKLANGLLAYTINGKLITEKDQAFYNTVSTPRGGQFQVTLSDGTKVWLNAASSIRFPVVFTGAERRVEVTGETYFEVAKNETMPFKVKAGTSEVEVLGTHFNINAYDDEALIKTTLLEGKVKVSAAGDPSYRFLSPGQQSGISKQGKITVLDHADTEEAVAWKNGRFQFKSADLQTILRQLSRWYDADIEYRGRANLHFTGQLTRNAQVSGILEKLEMTGEVHFTIENKKIIVSPK